MKKVLLMVAITMATIFAGNAQIVDNLIYNGSFEEHTICPERVDALGIMRGVDAWWQPTAGSSDYFNPCGGKECGVPRNKMGSQTAHTGDAYCGIYCSQENYREYLQTELKTPLEAGRRYRITFFVSLSEKSPHAMSTIGALFSTERFEDNTSDILKNREIIEDGGNMFSIATFLKPQVVNPLERALSDTKGWTEVNGTFTANGGERYLTIGNFADFNHSGVIDMHNNVAVLQGAYYYIDDVSVKCLDCTVAKKDTMADTLPKTGDIVTLKEVYFDVDSYELLPQSYNELTALVDLLNARPEMKIELRGHTDNSGTWAHNMQLSEDRAKAVMDYLVSRGIDASRLTSKGFGKTKPVSQNDTPEGRSLNRRVEYRVL